MDQLCPAASATAREQRDGENTLLLLLQDNKSSQGERVADNVRNKPKHGRSQKWTWTLLSYSTVLVHLLCWFGSRGSAVFGDCSSCTRLHVELLLSQTAVGLNLTP